MKNILFMYILTKLNFRNNPRTVALLYVLTAAKHRKENASEAMGRV